MIEKLEEEIFFVYEDWTLENDPRCFYVGKGNSDRIRKDKRNDLHENVVKIFGHKRIITKSFNDEKESLAFEIEKIKEFHTCITDTQYNGIGCNKTTGGQGTSGRIVTQKTKDLISKQKRGKTPNKIWSQKERDDAAKRMRLLHLGKKLSEETKKKIKETLTKDDVKKRHCKSVSDALIEKYKNDSSFCEKIKNRRLNGGKASTKFSNEEVLKIRCEYAFIELESKKTKIEFIRSIALKYDMTTKAIWNIVKKISWKHL